MKDIATTFRDGPRAVPVEWSDCAWRPRITKLPVERLGWRVSQISQRKCLTSPLNLQPRRNTIYFKAMKTNLPSSRRSRSGFTLVELLTVIGIIAILAALLLPVLNAAQQHGRITQAKAEESQLVSAIQKYDSDYGRFPLSTNAQVVAATAGGQKGDFTYGGIFFDENFAPTAIGTTVASAATKVLTNNEVMAILMDNTNWAPDASTGIPVNANYTKNPQQNIYLGSVKLSGYDPANPSATPVGGMDVYGNYRDPWGRPYVITMGTSYREPPLCNDWLYQKQAVSQIGGTGVQGYNGLSNPDSGGNTPNFQYHGDVMVWSAGPNPGMVDVGDPATDAQNKGHILSWQ
ncbi:MAG TPA: prepilin-type N-terminal cleavage/methylation domain-containing protein [Verrucomicrobiae bacterium]|jgi:prepilin-type N-terminal cleavage/methylation domain-containing protein